LHEPIDATTVEEEVDEEEEEEDDVFGSCRIS
jgi:hypothetical protein